MEQKRTRYGIYNTGVSSILLAGEGMIDGPLFNPLAMFAEIDLFKNWIPKLDFVKELKKVTQF